MRGWLIGMLAALLAVPAPAQDDDGARDLESGLASYFGAELAGNRTANGERCDPETLTAAHRTAPLGSRLRVTNLVSGDSVIVRVNDRGPFRGGRIVDLSRAAARAIGIDRAGTGRVSLALLAN